MNTLCRLVATAAATALSLTVLGAATSSPAAAAVGDEVIAWAEVEDGVITGGPVFNSGDHGNFSGTGSYTFRETGMTSTMTVNAPVAGVYPIHIRYAAGPLGADENITRSMGLLTNGGARQQLQFPMTSFADWEAWDFVSSTVTLAEGPNTVAIQCDRGIDFCRLNFDAIQVGGAAPDPCVATEPGPGYTSLFDGTFASFDGWRKAGGGGFGRQTDCTIRSIRGAGATWLTQQQTGPYTLQVDWRRNDSNDDSSVYVASSARGATPTGGYQVRIGAETGGIRPTGGETQVAEPAALASALRPVGEWNTFTIRVASDEVSVHLNGVLVNTHRPASPTSPHGFIGLENRSTGDTVDFRSIRIRPGVDPDPPEVVDSTTAVAVSPGTAQVRRDTVAVTATVSSPGATPTGQVEFYVGGVRQSTLPLVDGTVTANVGPFDTAGTTTVEARYLGDAATRPSSSPVAGVVVQRAPSVLTVSVKPKKVVAKRTRAKVVVAVTAPGVLPTGTVTVTVGKATSTAVLQEGRAVVKLKKIKKTGKVRAAVTYAGDPVAGPAAGTATVKVKRARR
ncbi:family 16 glycoside hydrolase [Nocardioides humi]|uniref:family 16 glycoside hydrolase n=1 Tax=Nocardioides humi TaxID=449461 RepID=UPI00112792E4|nr:family 16 glycoside hydrolase [Nocardioides humi]